MMTSSSFKTAIQAVLNAVRRWAPHLALALAIGLSVGGLLLIWVVSRDLHSLGRVYIAEPPPLPDPTDVVKLETPSIHSYDAEVGASQPASSAHAAQGTSPEPSAPAAGPNFAVIRVYYATDRDRTPSTTADEMFGVDRAPLSYGSCDVSIPRDGRHQIGVLEAPSIWRLEFREDPAKHIVLLATAVYSKEHFFAALGARVRASEKSSAFLFVHGYNVTFKDAARRTGQIAYDLSFPGAAVFYSWPSHGSLAAYTVDEQNIEWAEADLRSFLEDFFARSDAENIYLIAHSLGNRALTRVVASLMADKPALRNRLREVILTAPDIDADVFRKTIAPKLTEAGRPVTLYSSSDDLALAASKEIHGGYARAGDSGPGLVVLPGIETIDATSVDTSLLGHSYFADTRSVLSDMFYLITKSQRPDDRFGLQRVEVTSGRYWKFKQ